MSGQIENIPLHTREPGDEITEADLAKLVEATDPLTSAAVAAAAAAAAPTQGTTVTFNLEDLFVEYAYDEDDEDGEDEGEEDEGEEDEEDDDGVDEIYYNEAMDGWLGPWWVSV
ncbi:uncharacterized protein BO95DRAFT_429259 [Aspergillus brunneoviolaceus CBS 621.78]|uniref:Uncharacterized protein n=1 Tax=Aspergillus brunneoviolaceus CBS 621.78 TaxID=1450534 RepID=A0ACD1GH61_9EURO|nr:hypothetical protein BO95DRAFT_429259 [Aspergillus brunneoviolaceus CBS 621.78]RAH48659.1 hypothetical protein BO95DRAFT_429259 [Aspergillus brunneoviolaceus CBS 621.78]